MYEAEQERLIGLMKANGFLRSVRVEKALRATPRHLFVPKNFEKQAYVDYPVSIGSGQTISQPSTVAAMTELLEVERGQKILEIGTGSGWQAAILAKLVGSKGKVFTIERLAPLAMVARENLKRAKIENVLVVEGDGTLGFPEKAPYDRIIITAAAPEFPRPLAEQLKVGGIAVAPVGYLSQVMTIFRKTKKGLVTEEKGHFQFVPLVGKHGFG